MHVERYELIIMVTQNKLKTLELAVPFYIQNIDVKKIYVVASKSLKDDIEKIKYVTFVDEDSLYPGMNLLAVSNLIQSITGETRRAGWYLQQFLKFAWSLRCNDEAYVVIDADTFPLNYIAFQDDEGRYYFTEKIEYNQPYFNTIDNLFEGKIKRVGDFSFIAENMIFNCQYVREIIKTIEENSHLEGNTFWEKIIYSIEPDSLLKSGFSEFETYGNYVLTFHSERAVIRKLRTQREAVYILGSIPSKEKLFWAAQDYDIISIEVPNYKKTVITTIVNWSFVRKYFHMKKLVDLRVRVRSIYRKLMRKHDFKFE